jgi:c-di-AMP phosphodiesterase-like protein
MSDSADNNQTVRQIDWESFGEIFDLASEANHETGIRQAASLVSMYSMDIEEEYEPVTSSASLHSLDSLVSSFLHAWKVNLDAVAEQPKSGSIYWRDSKVLELGEYEYNFNHFFDNFDTIVRAVSRIESKSIAEPGIYQLSESLLEGLFKTSKSALANDNQDAAIEMMAIAIICGARFNNMKTNPEQFTEKLLNEFEGQKDDMSSLLGKVIPQLEADEEVDLFNTSLQASHFLPMLAVNDEENWFSDLQQYIDLVEDKIDT